MNNKINRCSRFTSLICCWGRNNVNSQKVVFSFNRVQHVDHRRQHVRFIIIIYYHSFFFSRFAQSESVHKQKTIVFFVLSEVRTKWYLSPGRLAAIPERNIKQLQIEWFFFFNFFNHINYWRWDERCMCVISDRRWKKLASHKTEDEEKKNIQTTNNLRSLWHLPTAKRNVLHSHWPHQYDVLCWYAFRIEWTSMKLLQLVCMRVKLQVSFSCICVAPFTVYWSRVWSLSSSY